MPNRPRSNNIVGVVIDGDVIRGVQLRKGFGRVQAVAAAEAEIPGHVADKGRVSDPDALADALRTLWREGGFSTKHVAFGIDGRDATFRRLSIPAEAGDHVEDAARFELGEYLTYDLDAAITHVRPVGRADDHIDVVAVAVRRDGVELIADAARRAGLRLRELTLSSTALGLDGGSGTDRADSTVVSVDGVSTTIVVRRGGLATITRVLTGGGGERAALLADEIEEALASVDQFRSGGENAGTREDPHTRRFRTVVEEVTAAIRHDEQGDRHVSSGGVLLCGAYGNHPALVELMAEVVDAPVEVVPTPAWWELTDEWPSFVVPARVALGAFDTEPGIVHLDAPSETRRRSVRREAIAGALLAALVGLPALAFVDGARAEADQAGGDAVAAEVRADLLAERLVDLDSLALLSDDLYDHRRLVADAVEGEIWWPRLSEEIAASIPDDTFLTALSLRRPSADPNLDEVITTASFGGVALDQNGVARWLLALEEINGIDEVWLVQSTASVYGELELPVVAFVAEAQVTSAARSPRSLDPLGEES